MPSIDDMSVANEGSAINERWAISTTGYGIEHGIRNRQKVVRLLIRGVPSSKPFSKWLEEDGDKALESRPAIGLTPQEQGKPEMGTTKDMLWVGLFVPEQHGQLKNEFKKRGNAADDIGKLANYKTPCLRVATPRKAEITKVNLYALVNSRRGLCEAFMITQANCLFFAEFRTPDVAGNVRRQEWSKKVKEMAALGMQGTQESTIEPERPVSIFTDRRAPDYAVASVYNKTPRKKQSRNKRRNKRSNDTREICDQDDEELMTVPPPPKTAAAMMPGLADEVEIISSKPVSKKAKIEPAEENVDAEAGVNTQAKASPSIGSAILSTKSRERARLLLELEKINVKQRLLELDEED